MSKALLPFAPPSSARQRGGETTCFVTAVGLGCDFKLYNQLTIWNISGIVVVKMYDLH
jgi:hypothetical protein